MDSRAIIGIIDNLESTSTTDALSANQGRVLNENKFNVSGDLLNNTDLNDLIGKVYIGYGHTLSNVPQGTAGYIVNIPNPNNPGSYTKQLYCYYSSNVIYARNYNNGVWSDWEAINGKNVITARLSNDITGTSNTDIKLPLILENHVGNKLTISDGGIKIGSGVSKVLVSANVYYGALGNVGAKNMFIYKNDSSVARKTFRAAGNYDGNSISSKLINVQENDVLYLYTEVYDNDVVSSSSNETYMTVEVVG